MPKIGFCNGVFDLFHDGHKHFLEEAAKHCDRLYVGVNTDESVRAIKGEERPFWPFEKRSSCVLFESPAYGVGAFSDEIASKVLAQVKPDVIIRGWDQSLEGTEGYEVVRIGRHGYCSTTNIIERMRA